MIRPLNDRVLIRPHKNPNETASGLVLPENRSDQYTEMQGTVVAVGRPRHPLREKAHAASKFLHELSVTPRPMELRQISDLLEALARREPCVKKGDDVLFSYTAGQALTIDDERYLLMREDDLLAVLES